ncbi:hypothetical protein H6A68_02765 [Bifidobacterium pullorum subsp. saeculare]|uniref:hypothetical protein n=1 Tax=Bifidobacterium pullorum TaxID=78448 RepID=UPI00195EE1F2|nr:hypothetical protein [Bifidobacterium pullorum]MBM6705985.1 hypothetical protein [Bifidobacterium pullorum subsp. saeculare]
MSNPTRITIPNDFTNVSTIDDIAGDFIDDYDLDGILEDLPDALDRALMPYGVRCDRDWVWSENCAVFPDANALYDALRYGDLESVVGGVIDAVMSAHDVSHRD